MHKGYDFWSERWLEAGREAKQCPGNRINVYRRLIRSVKVQTSRGKVHSSSIWTRTATSVKSRGCERLWVPRRVTWPSLVTRDVTKRRTSTQVTMLRLWGKRRNWQLIRNWKKTFRNFHFNWLLWNFQFSPKTRSLPSRKLFILAVLDELSER